MNISQYSGNTILDVQDRNRQDQRLQRGTSIQPILPVQKPGDSDLDAQGVEGGDGDFSFDSLVSTVVDAVNPLQHIPGVSTAYQSVTGDTQNALSSMAGGFLFGGPMGLAAGAAASFFEFLSGQSIGQTVSDFFSGEPEAVAQSASDGVAQIGDGSPMLQRSEGNSLQNYQTYADAQASTKLGYGADANAVAWAANTWTAQALQQATGAYETAQQARSGSSGQTARFG
ncbi:MAG: hypothetical protein COB59_04235 [Rhodospirillaceae bacterium]|nr:MAG: hypothetical protein COB59_04235 [Rhodospirillaceae bacterium]